jgi:hypothetical protein
MEADIVNVKVINAVRAVVFRIMYCDVSGVCVTNNNGFWIGWLDILALLLLQLLLITIDYITAYNRWLPKTRSIPSWTTSVFSSTVTDLVLIYESDTSSAFLVRWLTLHNWTLNHEYSLTDFSFTTERLPNKLVNDSSTTESINYVSSFYNFGRTEERQPPRIVGLSFCLFVVTDTCLPNRCLAIGCSASVCYCVNVC